MKRRRRVGEGGEEDRFAWSGSGCDGEDGEQEEEDDGGGGITQEMTHFRSDWQDQIRHFWRLMNADETSMQHIRMNFMVDSWPPLVNG
nr:probable methyltransferase PMT6 [Tanacetum cinerariifolium]